MDNPISMPRSSWYLEEKPHDAIAAVIRTLDDTQSIRSANNLRYARLYGNLDIVGLSPMEYFRTGGGGPTVLGSRLTWNVVKSMVDTVTSKIAKNKPRPVFLTDDGDWDLQQKAQGMTQWVQGVFYETKYYEKAPVSFRDCGIFGGGYLKIFKKDGRPFCERVIQEEIIVDAAAAVYGNPRDMFQKKTYDRNDLIAMFPEQEQQIRAAQSYWSRSGHAATTTNDLVEVIEGWHLPNPDGSAGVHCIVIQNATLLREPYKRKRFPFVMIPWTPPIVGFYPIGLAEELIGIQLEINKLLRQIQLSHHLLAVPKVFIEASSDVVSAHINNEVGSIVKYRGTMPEVRSFQTVHPEIYQHLDRLYSRAYEIAGVSVLSAQSKKPAGLDSGKALREFSDIESERFAITQQRWEQMAVDAASHFVELAEIEGGFRVLAPEKDAARYVDFKDVKLDEMAYVLRCYPDNFLPETPAGKIQSATELIQNGLLDREVAVSLLDFPDLKGAINIQTAAYRDAMCRISLILSKGQYEPADPFSDIALCKRLGQAHYLDAKVKGVPKARLELLRRWILDCARMEAETTAAAQPPTTPVLSAQTLAGGSPVPGQAANPQALTQALAALGGNGNAGGTPPATPAQ